MSDYNESQNSAHPDKTNILMSAIVVILVLIISLQLWILYGALNTPNSNPVFVWTGFGASLLLFIVGLWLLRYPPKIKTREVKDSDNPYE
jgi:high-affinity Fe2+/Pb2+ permease